ncbi:Armadillo [Macleaya cordata]|uniref:U-box domain-containing protein n=1 Tax=Macleaya cordata TaxID=56857 RepID=A0A200QM96_MACCD|nr:Armadillo [Macleaya cordata]
MVRNDLFITVPNFFKCPISLDVMKSPVSLCTGVTYDRSSIQKWLDNGNNTCPATMQVLQSKDFVPNHTLRRLIRTWSDSIENPSDSNVSNSPPLLSNRQIQNLIKNIENRDENCFDCLCKIADFADDSVENRKFVANIEGFLPVLVGVLSNADVDYDLKIRVLEQTVRALDLLLTDYVEKEQLMRSMVRNQDLLSSIVLVLQKGCLDSKIRSARVLETLAVEQESKLLIGEKEGIIFELLRLISSESDSTAIEAGLSCLISLAMPRRIRLRIVRFGSVQKLGKLLSNSDSRVSIIEKVLKLLEMLSTCTEGRTAICEDPVCVKAIVQKMLKVSKSATDHAVVILWSVCYLFRDSKAQEAVTKSSNGSTKILLLMQSNCSPSVRQMCGDLLKIFRVNSKSCLSSYDTKTTHIMPF